jgi:hypothetical protein
MSFLTAKCDIPLGQIASALPAFFEIEDNQNNESSQVKICFVQTSFC